MGEKPVTLQMLLDIYQEDGGFPETTSELYEKGCRFLCEYEGRRGTIKWKGDFDSEQRMAVAGRLAALMTFGGLDSLAWNGHDYS